MKNFILDKITDGIIKDLENGIIAWDRPFNNPEPKNYITGKNYNGFNRLILGISPFKSSYWLTYNQARQLGGSIKSGSKGTPIVFYKISEYATEDSKGDLTVKTIPFIQYSTVFNFDQTNGLQSKDIINNNIKPIEEAEEIVKNYKTKPEIKEGKQPCYIPNRDIIEIPKTNSFKSEAGYYSTLFHELAHSTGHQSRLNREELTKVASFGSEDYSKEELIAEFSSSFLCSKAGILKETRKNNTAYIQSWLKALKNDKSQLITASSKAQKVYNYILNLE